MARYKSWDIKDYKDHITPVDYKYHKSVVIMRTCIAIVDFALGDWKEINRLRNRISLWETSPYGGKYKTFELSFIDINNEGYHILKIPKFINPEFLNVAFPDFRLLYLDYLYSSYKVIDIPLREGFQYKNESQKQLVDYLTRQNEYSNTDEYTIEVIKGPTSLGKSYATIRYWEYSRGVLCGIFAKLNHLLAFKEEVIKFTLIDPDEIVIISKLDDLYALVDKKSNHKLILITHRLLSNSIYGDDLQSKMVTNLFKKLKIKTILFDEAHLELLSLLGLVIKTNVYKIICLSATPSRTDAEEKKLMGYGLPMAHLFTIHNEKRAYIYQYRFMLNLSDKSLINLYGTSGKKKFNVYNFFNELFADSEAISKWYFLVKHYLFDDNGSTVLVMASSLNYISLVTNALRNDFPDLIINEYSSNVNIEKEGKEILDNSHIIITTEKSFNGSINPLNVTRLVISAPLISPIWVEQVVGRLRGSKGLPCTIIDLAPIDHERLIYQAEKRVETYNTIAKQLEIYKEEASYD